MKKDGSALANVGLAVSFTILGFLLYAGRDVITLVVCAALAAIVATPAIDRLHTKGIGHWHPSYLEALLGVTAAALSIFLLLSALPSPSTVATAVSSLSLRSVAGTLRDSLAPS